MKKSLLFKNTSGRLRTIWLVFLPVCLAQLVPVLAQSSLRSVYPALGNPAFASVQINEIFPRGQADIPEWFELINGSETTVNLRNWRYGKAFDTAALTQDSIVIEPKRYAVVTKNKAAFALKYPLVSCVIQPVQWRTLDNYKDTVQLWDAQGVPQEMAAYQSDWFDHWTDESLERISLQRDGTLREAWVVAEKPTPGQPNASILFRAASRPTIEIGPIPFTPNGDGKDDFLSIVLFLPAAYTSAICIYGFNGKKYIDLPITPQPQYQWNGKTADGAPAPVGPFFVVATFKSGSQSVVNRKKGILWR
jgi:hypothetical protein